MEPKDNRISITGINKALCDCLDISSYHVNESSWQALKCDEDMSELLDYVHRVTNNQKINKMLIYNPDAIGEWIYKKYPLIFKPIDSVTELTLRMKSVFPPKTPVCFASIYSGLSPEEHGIIKYEKKRLEVKTFFDTLASCGKKACIVTVANQSMDVLFRGRKIDYYTYDNDREVVNKAIELINENVYDVICVYNQQYDDALHRSSSTSLWARRALRNYNSAYAELANAVQISWGHYNSLIGCLTDHGSHRAWYGLGTHGKDINRDMNICHFYTVYPKK